MVTEADELFYGGAAGGGKSDLVLGLALTSHTKSIVFRREFKQITGATGLLERSHELLDTAGARYNGMEHVWRGIPGGRSLEFGGCQRERDKHKWQGHPHDLKAFDEITEFTESQYRFLKGWNRTTRRDQRCRVVCTGNPPSHADGLWVIKYWAPWLDPQHTNPAEPGELRWFATIDGDDVELPGPEPVVHEGETIIPTSRTFIPARLHDNPFLVETGYGRTLQSLPEPLRTQLLYGDFSLSLEDDPWQIIPAAWVWKAFERWDQTKKPSTPLTALAVDVARGGKDETVLARRYDNWFAELEKHAGSTTRDGPAVAVLVTNALEEAKRDAVRWAYEHAKGTTQQKRQAAARMANTFQPPVAVDIIGVGTSPYDVLNKQGVRALAINFAAGTAARDASGKYAIRNKRAEAYWRMREALDPSIDPETGEPRGDEVALSRDGELLADLTAAHWSLTTSGILVESKEDIKARLGRSTDCGDAVVMTLLADVSIMLGFV